jgi:hypothetical protein
VIATATSLLPGAHGRADPIVLVGDPRYHPGMYIDALEYLEEMERFADNVIGAAV